MKSLNEVKNELCISNQALYGWEACEDELIKRAEGRQFWMIHSQPNSTPFTVLEKSLDDELKEAMYQTHVIEMTAYNAIQIKLDKAIEALIDCVDAIDNEKRPCVVFARETLKQIGAE